MPDEELEEQLTEVSEQDLFDDAVSDEPERHFREESREKPAPEEPEQARDEAGRFVKADEPKADEPTAEKSETAEKPAVDDNAAMVPSWRVREINEEKRAYAERIAALEAERNQWLQQRQAQPEAKAEKPDPLLDPEGYEKYLETRFEEKLLNNQRETSLANAHKTYKDEFVEAYRNAQQNIDPALKARMQQSRDPGETLIQWHREQKTMREVGSDPNAWLEKKMAERLKDPAFLAKAVELARGAAAPQGRNVGSSRSADRPLVDLPPSLNSASRAATRTTDDSELSDAELFRQITG